MLVASRRTLRISSHELSSEQKLIVVFTRSRLVTSQAQSESGFELARNHQNVGSARCEVLFGPGVDLSLEAFPQSLPSYRTCIVVECVCIWSGERGV